MEVLTMNDIAGERGGPMRNPPQLGELIRESMDDLGWNVTETEARLVCERGTFLLLLDDEAGRPATMALEDIGWGTAEHRMRVQVAVPAPVQDCRCSNSIQSLGSGYPEGLLDT